MLEINKHPLDKGHRIHSYTGPDRRTQGVEGSVSLFSYPYIEFGPIPFGNCLEDDLDDLSSEIPLGSLVPGTFGLKHGTPLSDRLLFEPTIVFTFLLIQDYSKKTSGI